MFYNICVYDAGDQKRTPLQSSDSRKKISFRWNSRGFPAGSLVVPIKSAEQRSTESGKLVPYEDDSETEKETTETTENMHVVVENTNDRDGLCAENTCSPATMSLLNGEHDDDVSASDTEKLCKPAEPIVTSSTANGVSGIVEGLPSFNDDNSGTSVLSESSSKPVSVPDVEETSAEKEDAASLSGTAEGGFAADDRTGCQLKNGHLSGDGNSVSNAFAGRKRHARHKSKKHHKKHRRRHATSDSYSSGEELEYVWVEKTAETIAQQHTGRYQL